MTEGQGLIDSMADCSDSILGLRDSIGAVLKPTFLVTRTWTGEISGDGEATDEEEQMLPSPGIKTFEHDLRIQEGGVVKQGDILLRGVSKNKYDQETVERKSAEKRIEKLYRVGDSLYSVVSVVEKQLTWDVLLRRISDQTRY
jgi:hypothetical protein